MSIRRTGEAVYYISIILVVLVATSLPYLLAERAAGANYSFGGFLLNPLDGNSYLAKMYAGWRGEWRFQLPYTADPGRGAYLFLFYLFLGHISRWFGLPLLFVFHAARLAAALLMLLAVAQFFRRVLPEPRQQWGAFLLAAIGSGMGWLAVPFGAFSADFWVAEAYPFLSAYANPHFPLSLALMVWMLGELLSVARELALEGATPPKGALFSQPALRLALASLVLALLSPFAIVLMLILGGGLALWIGFESRSSVPGGAAGSWWERYDSAARILAQTAWIVVGGVPILLYDVWATRADPILAGWNAQNVTPTPPPWDLLLAFSPLLVLAALGAWVSRRKPHTGARLLLVWALAALLLVYVPFGLQRRFLLGLYLPLAGLAALGITSLSGGELRRERFILIVTLLLVVPTNLVILLSARHAAQTHDPLIYLTRAESQGMEWIASNTPQDALVLAAPQTGLFIPAHTGRRVIYGHPFETVNAPVQQSRLLRFFGAELPAMDGAQAQAFIDQTGASYLFWGPRERLLGELPPLNSLQVAFQSAGVSIYALGR